MGVPNLSLSETFDPRMLGGWEPDVVFTLLFQTGFVSDSLLLIVAVCSEFRSALVKRIVRLISAGGRRALGE